MPVEYCLPLTDFDLGEGVTQEALEEWHGVSSGTANKSMAGLAPGGNIESNKLLFIENLRL